MRGWRALAVVALLGACAEAAPPVSDDGAGSRADSGRVLPDVDAALLDASDEDAPAADASEEDASDEDTRVADTSPEDASPEDAGEEDTSTAPSDVLIDDTFTRPPIDAGDEGDTAADAPVEDVSAEDTSSDIADAPADDTGSTDVAPDVPDPPDTDPVVYAIDESGREGCLRWTIRAEFDTFDFKADDFLVRYEVESECPETLIYAWSTSTTSSRSPCTRTARSGPTSASARARAASSTGPSARRAKESGARICGRRATTRRSWSSAGSCGTRTPSTRSSATARVS